jgi:hypothetical protein
MELSNLDVITGSNEGFDVVIFNPKDNQDTDIVITVLGRDSDTFRRMASDQARRRVSKFNRGGSFRANQVPTIEEVDADTIAILAACTTGWKNVSIKGEELAFSKDNAARLYKEYPWIRDQVDAAVADRGNFMKGA